MNNFSSILEEINSMLPLMITSVQLLGEQLIIKGNTWEMGFTTSWWRVLESGVLLFAYEEYNDSYIQQIKGLSIQKVVQQSYFIKSDFVLILSNGYILETFSTSSLEPWCITISGRTYYGDPSEKRWAK